MLSSRLPSILPRLGGVAERFKAPVLKTGVLVRVPWVRIPPPPLQTLGSCARRIRRGTRCANFRRRNERGRISAMSRVEITTADGTCPSYVFRPATGSGPWPAVLVFMDGVGIRPALLELGVRLAKNGYFVLLPDLFYRSGPYEAMDARTVFSDPEQLKRLREKFSSHVSQAKIMSDTRAFLDYLASEPDVKAGGIGVTGYCMGGLMALTAAGTFPERIVAAASFHGSRLATDAPESPHWLAPKMKARLYVAGAIEDATFPDE